MKWATPKGGLRLGARPGGKELLGNNHEAASVSWTGRANPPNFPWKGFSPGRGDRLAVESYRPVAQSARRILRKPIEAARKRASPPMLFAQNLLVPGPQPKHPEIVNPPQADYRKSREFTLLKLDGKQFLVITEWNTGMQGKS